jgi:ribonuclease P protein component
VTSSKAAKKAVDRNKLRRRIYAVVFSSKPPIQGIVYAAKQSYGFTYDEVKSLTLDLLAKASKAASHPSK